MSKDYTVPAVIMLGVGTLLIGVTSSLSPVSTLSSTEEFERVVATPVTVSTSLAVPVPELHVSVFTPTVAQDRVVEPDTQGEAVLKEHYANPIPDDPIPPREDHEDAVVTTQQAEVQEEADSSCLLSPSEGGVVVDFIKDDTRPLRADGSRAEAERTASLALPEGSYTATIAVTREGGDSGRLDRVYLKFYDAYGALIATTSPTRDLKDGERNARERTETFELSRAVSSVTVRHLAYATTDPHFLSVPYVLIEPVQNAASERGRVPQASGDVRELEVSVVSEAGEESVPVPEPSLGTGELFSVSEREEVPHEAVPAVREQTAAVGNADIVRVLLPLVMLALTLVGLLALSLVRPRV